jgi:HSP20 family protein
MYFLPKLWTQFAINYEKNETNMRFEVIENKEDYKIQATMVGIDMDQVNIDLEDHLLTITVNVDDDHTKNEEYQLLWSEFSAGSVGQKRERKFRLPNHINLDEIEATLINGVLSIKLPKQAPNKQKITLKSALAG